jgi:hypothetical protein
MMKFLRVIRDSVHVAPKKSPRLSRALVLVLVLDFWFGLLQLARIGSGGASPYRPPVSR